MSLSIGVDIGGTFTDVVAVSSSSKNLFYTKIASTPPQLVNGFLQGIEKALSLSSSSYEEVARIVHGTTVGTNAILQAKGAKIGILVTEGFEDVLTIGRQKRSEMYNVFLEPETPIFLTPRHRIYGIHERVFADGGIEKPLDEQQVAQVADQLVNEHSVESVAVCYLFSFVNPIHEQRTRDILLQYHPELRVSISSDLDPRFREYERLCLTAFDAYLRPVVERYIGEIRQQLEDRNIKARFHIMHSRGGVTSDETIVSNTVSTVLSGPAAGVIGGLHACQLAKIQNLITLDMGGTSCDVALVEKGKPILSSEGKIAKYPLRQPMLDINTIGAGGGSIAWLDEGGGIRVGPHSAGASPGPACYGTGGDQPTVTDASLVLGYLNSDYFAGGARTLSTALAEEAIEKFIAQPLGLTLAEAAQGIHTIVNNNMADEIRLVSVFRGYDPRNFSLVAMGGAGPVHAGRLAQQTYIKRVLVPRSPGVQSAFGLLVANLEHEQARTYPFMAAAVDTALLGQVSQIFQELESRCAQKLELDRMEGTEVVLQRSVEARYRGQSYELEVPFPQGEITPDSVTAVIESFHSLHERAYGHRDADDLVEIVTARVVLSQAPPRSWSPPPLNSGPKDPSPTLKGRRKAYFQEASDFVDTPIYARDKLLAGMEVPGPAIVEQEDTTIVVYPGQRAAVDKSGNILIQVL